MSERRTTDRDVGLVVALAAGAAGVLTGNPSVFVAATVGLVYAAYQAASSAPEPRLTVERTVDPSAPLPGADVEVTVSVRNDGRKHLPDVRVIDGVPSRLRVVDGSPRFGTALAADESASFSYALRAKRGSHEFEPATVVCRNLAGEVEFRATTDVETPIDCRADVEGLALVDQTLPVAGRVETDAGGEGVAFHAIREYQPSDPMSRIDWNRFARTTELATVEFSETRAASVVLLVDVRDATAAGPREPNAIQFGAYAAERLATVLIGDGNSVGAATFDACAYCEPSRQRSQPERIRSFLADEIGTGSNAGSDWRWGTEQTFFDSIDGVERQYGLADGGDPVATLDRTVPDDAQIVFCTPLLDDASADAVERLDAYGHAVTVLSPDVTTTATPGGTLARMERSARVEELRGTVRVVDWATERPLSKALLRATERWSA